MGVMPVFVASANTSKPCSRVCAKGRGYVGVRVQLSDLQDNTCSANIFPLGDIIKNNDIGREQKATCQGHLGGWVAQARFGWAGS